MKTFKKNTKTSETVREHRKLSKVFLKGLSNQISSTFTMALLAIGLFGLYKIPSYSGYESVAVFVVSIIFLASFVLSTIMNGRKILYKSDKNKNSDINIVSHTIGVYECEE